MDVRLQKMQELLIKGLIPVAKLAGLVGEAIEGTSDMPDEKSSWEDLSSAVVLIAGANHELNMCRRDLFKADLDKDYKALCNNKHPVEGELFGEDLAERLKTVKESNKASKQLTKTTRVHQRDLKDNKTNHVGIFCSIAGDVLTGHVPTGHTTPIRTTLSPKQTTAVSPKGARLRNRSRVDFFRFCKL